MRHTTAFLASRRRVGASLLAALVNLAVVTNVLPYIVSLSALFVMMRHASTEEGTFKRNAVVTTIALLYSVYAIYASGKDAVLGGMLVMAIGYVIYGFLAPRFTATAAARPAGRPAVPGTDAIAAV